MALRAAKAAAKGVSLAAAARGSDTDHGRGGETTLQPNQETVMPEPGRRTT